MFTMLDYSNIITYVDIDIDIDMYIYIYIYIYIAAPFIFVK